MTNRVLLVEDDPGSRWLLASMLADMGYGVTSVANGEEALRYLYSEEACDLILSDIVMPYMSGVQLAKQTHDARPGVPVVFVTGVPGAVDEALLVGAIPLTKPISRARLAQILDAALGKDSLS